MALLVVSERCAGCGVCVEICSVGAIQLVDQRASIDEALCVLCEACADACPDHAITVLSEPARSLPIAAVPVAETQAVPLPGKVTSPPRVMTDLAGTVLALLGRELVPRLADLLVAALEQRLKQPIRTVITPFPASSRVLTNRRRPHRRQTRYRGRRVNDRYYTERR